MFLGLRWGTSKGHVPMHFHYGWFCHLRKKSLSSKQRVRELAFGILRCTGQKAEMYGSVFCLDLHFLSLYSDVFNMFSLQMPSALLLRLLLPFTLVVPPLFGWFAVFPFCLTALQRDSCFGLPNIQQRRQDLYDRGFSMCLAVCILNPYLSVCLYFKFAFCFLAHWWNIYTYYVRKRKSRFVLDSLWWWYAAYWHWGQIPLLYSNQLYFTRFTWPS